MGTKQPTTAAQRAMERRAAALRENLRKRKTQAELRDQKQQEEAKES